MKRLFLRPTLAAIVICCASSVHSESVVTRAPEGVGATTVYRQVMPDGRIVYSDKLIKGGKLDRTITIDQPIKGNSWSTASGTPPAMPPKAEATQVNRVSAIPAPGKKKALDDATSEVIRAEMLLEDAKKRQAAGSEPQPGERTGNVGGGARLNETYEARQKSLAQDVATAETTLNKAIAERDALRNGR